MDRKLFRLSLVITLIIGIVTISLFIFKKEMIVIRDGAFLESMNRGRDYWDWYMTNHEGNSLENILLSISSLLNPLMYLFLVFVGIVAKNNLSFGKIATVLVVAFLINFLQKYVFYNFVYHNGIYTLFIEPLILSLACVFLAYRASKIKY